MSLTTGGTAGTIVTQILRFFQKHDVFKARAFSSQDYYDMINEALDELYDDCYPVPEEFTVTTVVGTEKYPMDGEAAGHLSDEIAEVKGVSYNGAFLDYRYFYSEQVTPKAATDANGSPDGWVITEISGVRYLVLVADGVAIGSDSAVEVRVFGFRIPAAITALTSTGSAIRLERNRWGLVKWMVICSVYLALDGLTNEDLAKWAEFKRMVAEGKTRMREGTAARLGQNATQIDFRSADDVLE
jgi:hypothetical protein